MKTHSTATLLFVVKDPMVLLGLKTQGDIGKNKVNAPGGKWEQGENLLECAVRELREELGIIVQVGELRHIGVLECFSGDELFQIVHVYRTETFAGMPQRTESMEPLWVHKDKLPYASMHQADRFWFLRAIEGKQKFLCRIWYERPGEGYLRHELLDYAC